MELTRLKNHRSTKVARCIPTAGIIKAGCGTQRATSNIHPLFLSPLTRGRWWGFGFSIALLCLTPKAVSATDSKNPHVVRRVNQGSIVLGNGKVIKQSFTGDSIHYTFSPDGNVFLVLPGSGLYRPRICVIKEFKPKHLHPSSSNSGIRSLSRTFSPFLEKK